MLAYQLVALGGLEIENPTLYWYSVSRRITYLLCLIVRVINCQKGYIKVLAVHR